MLVAWLPHFDAPHFKLISLFFAVGVLACFAITACFEQSSFGEVWCCMGACLAPLIAVLSVWLAHNDNGPQQGLATKERRHAD